MSAKRVVDTLRSADELIVPCRQFLNPDDQEVILVGSHGEIVAKMSVTGFLEATNQADVVSQVYEELRFAPDGEQVLANAVGVPLRFGFVDGIDPYALQNHYLVRPA